MREDILAIVTGSSLPLSEKDVIQDAAIWPMNKGGKRREVDPTKVAGILESLRSDGLVTFYEGRGWHRPVPREPVDPQKFLFEQPRDAIKVRGKKKCGVLK